MTKLGIIVAALLAVTCHVLARNDAYLYRATRIGIIALLLIALAGQARGCDDTALSRVEQAVKAQTRAIQDANDIALKIRKTDRSLCVVFGPESGYCNLR